MKYITILLFLLTYNHSNSQESIILKESVNLISFSNKSVGINLIEFIIYKDLDSLSEQIKKYKLDRNNCKVILKLKILKPDTIELVGYTSKCNFEYNIVDFLKETIHLKIIKCEMKLDETELSIPININYVN